jgi:6-phosphogluconolactonase
LIRIFDDLEALSRGAAELLVNIARQAVAARGRFSAALSGGATPQRTYELLATAPYREQVDWARAHIFWGDERCVAEDDPRSNARLVREALLRQVPVPAGQVHPMDCRPSPGEGARRYEALLREFFALSAPGSPCFDLILLGLGENGHTASLFPGTPALIESERWVAEVYVAQQELHRLTLTAALINGAAAVVFLVAGAAKAAVVQEVIQGPRDPGRLPAQLINPQPGALHWLLDRAAAGALSREYLCGQVDSVIFFNQEPKTS